MASTVAIVNDNSVNFIDNDIEYYVVSDKLSKSELFRYSKKYISTSSKQVKNYLLF